MVEELTLGAESNKLLEQLLFLQITLLAPFKDNFFSDMDFQLKEPLLQNNLNNFYMIANKFSYQQELEGLANLPTTYTILVTVKLLLY